VFLAKEQQHPWNCFGGRRYFDAAVGRTPHLAPQQWGYYPSGGLILIILLLLGLF
jgi:hypothetical protein